MMVALDTGGNRIFAEPETKGFCPVCDAELIPKCGEIKTWHWAHKSIRECDTWAEPEGDWHYGWKSWFGINNTEIVIERDGQKHRADVRTHDGTVIELQHSPLSTKEVREREEFYGKMIWVLDGNEICPNVAIDQFVSKDERLYFRRGEIKKAWVNEITKPCYVHFNEKHYSTYFYYNEYYMVYGVLTKRLKKAPVPGAESHLTDFLIKLKKDRYCEVIPDKTKFLSRFGSYDKSAGRRSLFGF